MTGSVTNDGEKAPGRKMRSEQDLNLAIERYSDMVRRLCMLHLKNYDDAEDIFQNVFLKYVLNSVRFENEEHEKAWFIRVTINECRDLLRNFFRRNRVSIDEVMEAAAPGPSDNREVLEAVMSLPQKYRDVIYLHYYEGYTAPELGKMLSINVNTVYTYLNRGRERLKEKLGGDGYE